MQLEHSRRFRDHNREKSAQERSEPERTTVEVHPQLSEGQDALATALPAAASEQCLNSRLGPKHRAGVRTNPSGTYRFQQQPLRTHRRW